MSLDLILAISTALLLGFCVLILLHKLTRPCSPLSGATSVASGGIVSETAAAAAAAVARQAEADLIASHLQHPSVPLPHPSSQELLTSEAPLALDCDIVEEDLNLGDLAPPRPGSDRSIDFQIQPKLLFHMVEERNAPPIKVDETKRA